MKRILLAAVLLALSALPAAAQEAKSPSLKLETTIFAAAAAADWASTIHFMSYGVPEHFPVHRKWKHNEFAVVGVGASIDVATILIARKIGKRHPKLVKFAAYGASAIRFWVAFDNERDLRNTFKASPNCIKRCF
jgi:hypothetical protein